MRKKSINPLRKFGTVKKINKKALLTVSLDKSKLNKMMKIKKEELLTDEKGRAE